MKFAKTKGFKKLASLFIAVVFLCNTILPNAAFAAEAFGLPSPKEFVNLSGTYSFPVLKGLKFDPANPLTMEFIINNGDAKKVSKEEVSRLVRYFLAGLTVPPENLWVNLSPYEKDRILPDILTSTELGEGLLSQDYILKQISASLTYPESQTGKDFWNKTYDEVLKIAKTTNIPVNTFNKIWIVPDKMVVYENENLAVVAEASLKAMLEEDFLALKNNVSAIQKEIPKRNTRDAIRDTRDLIQDINKASSNVMREQILPKINADINKGKNFATLRQIYYSIILASWFKKKFKESLYSNYIDKGKIKGIDLSDPQAKEKVYNLYLQAFQKGLYNYIKPEQELATKKQIKRRYFSGGIDIRVSNTGTNFGDRNSNLEVVFASSSIISAYLSGGNNTEAIISYGASDPKKTIIRNIIAGLNAVVNINGTLSSDIDKILAFKKDLETNVAIDVLLELKTKFEKDLIELEKGRFDGMTVPFHSALKWKISILSDVIEKKKVLTKTEQIEIPPAELKDFAKNLSPFDLAPTKVNIRRLKGNMPLKSLLKQPQAPFAIGASIAAALGSWVFATGGKNIKEVADANAVKMVEDAILLYVQTHKDIAIVILGDEGLRDNSVSLNIGTIYYSGYKDTRKKINIVELNNELNVLKSRRVLLRYFVGDALELTNGLADKKAFSEPTNSCNLITFFDKKNLPVNDFSRFGGIGYNAPKDAGVTPFDLPSVALPKIAAAKGFKKDTKEYNYFMNHVTVSVMGPRDDKDKKIHEQGIAAHKHDAIIEDAKKMQREFIDLKLVTPSDGGFKPRLVSILGLNLDGRTMITFGRGGSAEETAALLAAANIKDGHFSHTYVSQKATEFNFSKETAYAYTPEEITTFKNFGISKQQYMNPRTEKAINGNGILVTTSVTGASPDIFGHDYADLFKCVKILPQSNGRGTITANTLIVTRDGSAFMVQTTMETADLDVSLSAIKSVSNKAAAYLNKQKTSSSIEIPGVGKFHSIRDVNIDGQRVVLRVDLNTPVEVDENGAVKDITDDRKIREILPTLEYITSQNPKSVTLVTHFGSKKDFSTEIIAKKLQKLLQPTGFQNSVAFLKGSVNQNGLSEDAISEINKGKRKICLLENIRFAKGEKEAGENTGENLRKQLAGLADIYVIDAAATIHRKHASMYPLSKMNGKNIEKAIGFLLEKELNILSKTILPKHPFMAIVGGFKVSDKTKVLETLVSKMREGDTLVIAGAMAYTFIKAKNSDLLLGNSFIDQGSIPIAKEILAKLAEKKVNVILPIDHIMVPDEELYDGIYAKTSDGESITENYKGVDIGPATINEILKAMNGTETIVWNGPLGAFEKKNGGFIDGTKAVAEGIKKLWKEKNIAVIAGGGDTGPAIKQSGISEDSLFFKEAVLTGGGASLDFIASDGKLEVLENLSLASSALSTKELKLVESFGKGKTTAEELFSDAIDLNTRKGLLGGKGEGLHSMTRAGIPVPPGFTITTEACKYYSDNNKEWPAKLEKEIAAGITQLEIDSNKKLGSNEKLLLVSVRSGAKFSMPGMMDTILNLGLNDTTVEVFARMTNNERLAWDSYRRFIQMFSDVVLGIEKKAFEEIIEAKKEELNVKQDVDLDVAALKDLVVKFKALLKAHEKEFPQDARQQLKMAINAVFESWGNPRAITYRNLNKIPHDLGTAVNVQAMVFGNSGDDSATGVGFTRNPSTGEKESFGEFLVNAQGEDVVAGIRTPRPVSELQKVMPAAYDQLMEITSGLEKYYKDVQDFEYTIENGKLYLLQTRSGKRTGVAAVKIAVDLVREGLITKEEALMRVDPKQINEVLFPMLDPTEKKNLTKEDVLATGLSAGPGAATGQIVFTSEDAVLWTNDGKQVILWREETCPDDIAGMDSAVGIGTSRGGMTSHAAVVARSMGKVTMVGAEQVKVNGEKKEAYITNGQGVRRTIKQGDCVTLNVVSGERAQLILGKKKIARPESMGSELAVFLSWAKEISKLRIRANADIPRDAKMAFEFGAEGIGLCRTEHMFFEESRLPIMQEMILADTLEGRQNALKKLLPMQKEDFIGLFREMRGYPVTIRLLDPPLHEFLPKREELMVEIEHLKSNQGDLAVIEQKEKLLDRINALHQFNPMMGLRGARLGITMSEITAMQARAIAEAVIVIIKEGKSVIPEIMIPLVGKTEEFTHQKKVVVDAIEKVMQEQETHFEYKVGTMIEVPRAAITAGEIAKEADFFSFGTNDLTQYGAGFSRDDTTELLELYKELGIYPDNPFETIDVEGIGKFVRMAVQDGRKTKPDLKIGVCGEHGGDPESIKFFHETGLDYASCSPYRILGAWLAAAQAQIRKSAPLTMRALKTALEKIKYGHFSLSIVSQPELGRKITTELSDDNKKVVISFGNKADEQDIKDYILIGPKAAYINTFFDGKAAEAIAKAEGTVSSAIKIQEPLKKGGISLEGVDNKITSSPTSSSINTRFFDPSFFDKGISFSVTLEDIKDASAFAGISPEKEEKKENKKLAYAEL